MMTYSEWPSIRTCDCFRSRNTLHLSISYKKRERKEILCIPLLNVLLLRMVCSPSIHIHWSTTTTTVTRINKVKEERLQGRRCVLLRQNKRGRSFLVLYLVGGKRGERRMVMRRRKAYIMYSGGVALSCIALRCAALRYALRDALRGSAHISCVSACVCVCLRVSACVCVCLRASRVSACVCCVFHVFCAVLRMYS